MVQHANLHNQSFRTSFALLDLVWEKPALGYTLGNALILVLASSLAYFPPFYHSLPTPLPETQATALKRTDCAPAPHAIPMPLGTFVTMIAAAASLNDPCTAQCRLHTCAIFNSSLSCTELSGLGCDCVSPCPV